MYHGSKCFLLLYIGILLGAFCLQGAHSIECLECADPRNKCDSTGYSKKYNENKVHARTDPTDNVLSKCVPYSIKIVLMGPLGQCFWSPELGCTTVTPDTKDNNIDYCKMCDEDCKGHCTRGRDVPLYSPLAVGFLICLSLTLTIY